MGDPSMGDGPSHGAREQSVVGFAWDETPLGPRRHWPRSLRAGFEVMLASPAPMFACWGPRHLLLYNDAFGAVAGRRHPAALGRPLVESYPEAVEAIASACNDDDPFASKIDVAFVGRDGPLREVALDAVVSTLRGDDGNVGGVLAVLHRSPPDTTAPPDLQAATHKLRAAEQRQRFVLALTDALRTTSDPAEIQSITARMLGERLGASRVMFYEFDAAAGRGEIRHDFVAHGGRSLAGSYSVDDYPASHALMRRGTLIVADTRSASELSEREHETLPALDIVSMFIVPLLQSGSLVATMLVAQDQPRQWTSGEVALGEDVAERTWAALQRGRAELALRDAERRQRLLVERIPQLVWSAAPNGTATWVSPQWTAYTGLDVERSGGHGWVQIVHPEDQRTALAVLAAAGRTETLSLDARLRHHETGQYRWFHNVATPIFDESGRVREYLGTSTDIDDMRRLQDRQQFLVTELQHRTRNLMGVVDTIATDTLTASASLPEFGVRFRGRLAALARVQSLLARIDDTPLTWSSLLRAELDAIGSPGQLASAVRLEGPLDVVLRFDAAQILALAVHELATNATKYGALAHPGATLDVRWRTEGPSDGPERLVVLWSEAGVPSAELAELARRPRGQGRELIEDGLPYQLDALTSWVLGDEGVRCRLEVSGAHWSRQERADAN